MQFICDILTVLLGYIEIDKFKVLIKVNASWRNSRIIIDWQRV